MKQVNVDGEVYDDDIEDDGKRKGRQPMFSRLPFLND